MFDVLIVLPNKLTWKMPHQIQADPVEFAYAIHSLLGQVPQAVTCHFFRQTTATSREFQGQELNEKWQSLCLGKIFKKEKGGPQQFSKIPGCESKKICKIFVLLSLYQNV